MIMGIFSSSNGSDGNRIDRDIEQAEQDQDKINKGSISDWIRGSGK
jgi:hypothetical protein